MGDVVYQMKMPASYVDMDSAEIQYDGGFDWSKALMIVAAVGAVVAIGGLGVGGVAAAWGGSIPSGALGYHGSAGCGHSHESAADYHLYSYA